jgi:nucleoside-diphosphate-sugar epimerase
MKTLVLGGTGAMGVHLVKLLECNGVDVFVTSRSDRKSKGRVRYLKGDAHDRTFIQSILKGKWDAIVDFMNYSTANFEANIDHLINATSHYLYLSSARVYAASNNPISEDSPRLLDVSQDADFLASDEYSLAKARQKNYLINSEPRNWTIIRPYITYATDRLQLGVFEKEEWLYRALRGRTIIFSKDNNAKMTTLTYGYDVSRAILAVLGNLKAMGNIYNITCSKAFAWSHMLDIYLDVLETHL